MNGNNEDLTKRLTIVFLLDNTDMNMDTDTDSIVYLLKYDEIYRCDCILAI